MTPADVNTSMLVDFVVREARLLDDRCWSQWLDLFDAQGWYWLPADAAHTDPLRQASHLYDDALLRRVRIERLLNPQAHSQQPSGRCHHLLQVPEVLGMDVQANRFQLRTSFLYTELRAGHAISLPGVSLHTLCLAEGQLRILLKRVELLQAAQPLPAIEFYI